MTPDPRNATPAVPGKGSNKSNTQAEGLKKQVEALFAESSPIDVPECLALETFDIARQQEANVPDDEIRKNIYATRNMIRMNEANPAKQAEACKRMMEMRQKFPIQRREKK